MISDDLKSQVQDIVDYQLRTLQQSKHYDSKREELLKRKGTKLPNPETLDENAVLTFHEDFFFEKNQDIIVVIDHKRSTHTPLHTHEFFEMFYVHTGECYSTGDEFYQHFCEDTLGLFSLQSVHKLYIPTHENVVFNILIRPSVLQNTFLTMLDKQDTLTHFFIDSIRDKELETPFIFFDCKDDDMIGFYIHRMIVEFYTAVDTKQAQNHLKIFLLSLLMHMSEQYKNTFIDIDKHISISKMEILDYFRKNVVDGSLDDMAARFHYSRRNMIYHIYKHTGRNFSELLKLARIDRMKELLTRTDNSLDAIASAVGYNTKYAYSLFKKEVGISMSNYRRENTGEKGRT